MSLKTEHYFLSPVEIIKVTTQNLQEVAEWCGGRVAQTESRRVQGRMDSYVWVPTPKGTAISWAFPGMYITKRVVVTVKDDIKVTYAVFRRDYFEKNYFRSPQEAVEKTWEKGNKVKQKHPKMAGKPQPLSLQVEIPPGTPAEEVETAMHDAVKTLQEQGVLAGSQTIEETAAAQDAEVMETVQAIQQDVIPEQVETAALEAIIESGLSPREVHDQNIASVTEIQNAQLTGLSLDKEPNAFGGTVEVVEED